MRLLAGAGISIRTAVGGRHTAVRHPEDDRIRLAGGGGAAEGGRLRDKRDRGLAVEVPDRPGGLAGILEIFEDTGINIEYMYAFPSDGRARRC